MINASLGRRLGAILYDSLLALALAFLGTLPFIAVAGGEPVQPEHRLLHQLTLLLILYLFFVGFWAGPGKTLGMQSWRLRLETPDGRIPGIGQCSIRFFAAILSWLPAGLGFWWQLIDRDRLTWHDRLSGTRLRFYPPDGARTKGGARKPGANP